LTRTQAYTLAAVVALAIVAMGVAYALGRPSRYESTAVVALAPRGDVNADEIPSLLGSFTNSSTIGTYVELIRAKSTWEEAGSPPVTVDARAVPASRVINVKTVGPESEVRPALVSLLRAAALAQQGLNDVWGLRVLQAAQPPVASGLSPKAILAGTLVLAAFSVALLFVTLRHLGLLPEPLIGAVRRQPAPRVVRQEPAPPRDAVEPTRSLRRNGRGAPGAKRAAILALLRERPGVSAREIADATGISRSTVTTTLSRLVDASVIERIQPPGGPAGFQLSTRATGEPGDDSSPPSDGSGARDRPDRPPSS
jgi:DNA-binding transcriptional ArsR family regulator